MRLSEDLFELVDDSVFMPDITPAPDIELAEIEANPIEPGPELGISNLLMQSIKDIYSMIEGYNSLSIALSDLKEEEMSRTISNIISEEHKHIGMLQDILKQVSPNAENIDAGEEIANSITESLDSVETPNEVKIFTEMSIDDFKNLSVDDSLKIIKNAFNCFKNDYNEILSIEDDIDYMDDIYSIKRNFYKKYLEFAKKCEEYLKNGCSISGYGINDILKIKIKEMCQTVSMHFPYGWK